MTGLNKLTPSVILNHVNALNDDAEQSDLLARLESVKIDLSKDVPFPQVCISMQKGYESQPIAMLGDFSVITGKAKAKKSFVIGVLVASVTNNGYALNNIKGNLPDDKREILYFDTEQSLYSVQLAAKRICKISDTHLPENLSVYRMREFNHKDMFAMIEAKLHSTPNVGFVVIDGVRDLVASINNEEEATTICESLKNWSSKLNIHIVVVLHQNKNDNSVRGHLGTELVNRAMTVISVTKDSFDPDISVVVPEQCRFRDFDSFAFRINDEGIPEIVDIPSRESGRKPAITPDTHTEEKHKEVLKAIFEIEPKPNGAKIRTHLSIQFGFGGAKAREFLEYYETVGKIKFQGKKGSRESYYVLPE